MRKTGLFLSAALLAACTFPQPQRTPPFAGLIPYRVQIPVEPGCQFAAAATWRVTLPTDGSVPSTASYVVEDSGGLSPSGIFSAGTTFTITLAGKGVPWRLLILGSDNAFHPITGWIVNPDPICV